MDCNSNIVLASQRPDNLFNRAPEVHNHLRIFHDYFYNIDQYNYQEKIERALNLIDDSGKNYYQTLLGTGWYSDLKLNNLSQKIIIDSIKTNVKKYPYVASIYGKTNVHRYGRESHGDVKKIHIRCQLLNVARTMENPHGLIINNYDILYHGKK